MTLEELYALADHDGVTVDAFSLGAAEALSIMDADGSCYVAIDPMQLSSETDEREKLAHELGHCVTGSFYNQYSPFDIRARHERRADAWAIRALVPRARLEALRSQIDATEDDIAERFGVSVGFLRRAASYYFGS